MSANRPCEAYRNTPLRRAVEGIVGDFQASREIKVETAPDYVIGSVCQELAAKWIVASAALSPER